MKPKKPKPVREMAEAFVWKFGSAPKSREWEFMVYAFTKGYACAKRRSDRSNAGDVPRAGDGPQPKEKNTL